MGLTKRGDGYMRRAVGGHPRADENGRVLEHVLIAERALGKPLPPKAIVHHSDRDRSNNLNGNLVICQDQAYHVLLHYRMRAIGAGRDPNKEKKCATCQEWKVFSGFRKNASTFDGLHPECKPCKTGRENIRKRKRRAERREAMAQ